MVQLSAFLDGRKRARLDEVSVGQRWSGEWLDARGGYDLSEWGRGTYAYLQKALYRIIVTTRQFLCHAVNTPVEKFIIENIYTCNCAVFGYHQCC